MLSARRRAQKLRSRTDLAGPAPAPRRRGRPALFRLHVPTVAMDDVAPPPRGSDGVAAARAAAARARTSLDGDSSGTRFFNDLTEHHWVLRGAGPDRRVVQLALESAARAPRDAPAERPADPLPQKRDDAPRSVSSEVSALLQPRRRTARAPSAPVDARRHRGRSACDSRRGPSSLRDRRVQFSRARRRDGPLSDDAARAPAPPEATESDKHAWYDPDIDLHWRLPIGKPVRGSDLLMDDSDRFDERDGMTRWSTGTDSAGSARAVRAGAYQADRSDRRALPSAWRDDASSGRPRDRSGKRIGNRGARWRGLMARKDLVDGKADAYCTDTNDKSQDLSPRSSLDIEEATSLYSWDEPPSTSVRGWRSNHSLSYRPQPDVRPRHIRDIGRQRCINDLTHIVDASNEPCVSYDRQIFDPVSKLWTYVEASQPSSSPWELRAVGSPVTCSVSGTEEAVSSGGRAAPASATVSLEAAPPPATPPAAAPQTKKRRNSSPGIAAVTSAMEAKRAFNATRDLWLGTTRKSVYGPANLEAVIFASEIDDAEEGILRRASMA